MNFVTVGKHGLKLKIKRRDPRDICKAVRTLRRCNLVRFEVSKKPMASAVCCTPKLGTHHSYYKNLQMAASLSEGNQASYQETLAYISVALTVEPSGFI